MAASGEAAAAAAAAAHAAACARARGRRGDPSDHHAGVGFTEELRPRAPPRPRALALSGAVVLNAGNVHSQTACSAVHRPHASVPAGAKRRIARMRNL